MIHTTLSNLLSTYLWLILGLLAFVWVYGEMRRRLSSRSIRRRLIQCRLCSEPFTDAGPDELVTCPRCQALNERRRPSRL